MLPGGALALSLASVVPKFSRDPDRDEILGVAAFTDPLGPAALFFMDWRGTAHLAWTRFFHSAAPIRRENLFTLDFVAFESRDRLEGLKEEYRRAIGERLERGEPVWIAGDPQRLAGAPHGMAFLEELRAAYVLEAPSGAPPNLLRLRARG